MPKATVNGFEMNYEIHEGLLPMDTVFLHGNLASNVWWRPSIELWKKAAKPSYKGRAIFAEWRGCGQSGAPLDESDLNPKVLASDYVALLETLGVRKAALVGHSTGGLIGLIAMLQKPELFTQALLLDPVAATGVQFEAPMYDAFTQMSQNRDICAAVMGATIHNHNPANPYFPQIVDDAFNIAKINWHGVPKALHTVNIVPELAKIPHPVLVLHGEFDNILPKEGSVFLAQHLPNGKFEEVKGHGHSLNMEDPQLFVNKVNSFLFERI